MKKLLFLVSALALLNACTYDNEVDLYGVNVCDTDSISFAYDIAPIIEVNCTSCHSGESPSASLDLTNFEALTASVLSSGNSALLNRIERLEGQSGAMPTNYRLTQCQIDQINAWVEQGALNN
tara:strand:- start:323 stop:691 length:369 start_codon:yes stop_codon:yes gene_type:complete